VAAEDVTKAFDAQSSTKWFARVATPWVIYQFAPGQTFAINMYTVTSGNDYPGRDPMNWRLQGSNDGVTWITVDTRMDQFFDNRFQTNVYTFSNPIQYPAYRFFVDSNAGQNGEFQMAELQLFGDPPPPPEGGTDAAADASVSSDASEGGAADDASSDGASSDGASSDEAATDSSAEAETDASGD
jgi:hypothetical protein